MESKWISLELLRSDLSILFVWMLKLLNCLYKNKTHDRGLGPVDDVKNTKSLPEQQCIKFELYSNRLEKKNQ